MNDEFTPKDYYFFLLFLFLSILIMTSGGGADFTHYLMWSKYFSTLNLDVFSDYPKSKNGLPLVHWHYGIGLFTSILGKILFLKGFAVMKTSSVLLTIINFALFYKICTDYKVTKFLFLFLISFAYLALPAGFYFNKFSTETWTIFLTLMSLFLIEHDVKNYKNLKNINLVIFGIILYFLILIKITNVFLASSLLLIFYVKKFDKISINKKNFYKHIKVLFFGSFFILLALIFLLTYYKLLNGSFLGSPYNFGNDKFSYVSITNLKLAEVLFSTWHGLLFYHPFYLLSIFFLLIIFLKKKLINDSSKWILLIVPILWFIHLMIHSSLHGWWWGVGTYGARGFAGVSILTFYAILNIKDNFKPIKFNFFIKIIILIVLVHQTYILSLGESNFYTLSNYLSFFITKTSLILLLLIAFLLLIIFIFKQIYKYNFSKFAQITIISMAFFASFTILFFTHKKPYLMLSLAILFSYFFTYSVQNYTNKIKQISSNFLHKAVSIIFTFLFLFSIFFQITLFTQYKENAKPNFISGRSFDCTDTTQSLTEYYHLPGYQDEKKKWLNFLKESGCI